MVPIGKNKVEDVESNKRPAPYSLPPKPNWKTLLNNSQSFPQKLAPLRPFDLKVSTKPPPLQPISPMSPESTATVKTFPVPMPRKNSSSSSDSTPKTPVPLPRTIFNIPTVETSALLGRSTSLPAGKTEPQVTKRLAHSIATPLVALNEEEDGDTWL